MRILRATIIGAALLLAGIGGAAHSGSHALASTHAGAKTLTVKIVTLKNGNFAFSPTTLRAKAGDKVVWKNVSGTEHTITFDTKVKGKPLLDKTINTKTVTWTAAKAGTFKYHCTFHPNMTAKIVVK